MFGIVSTVAVAVMLFGSSVRDCLRRLCAGVNRSVGHATSVRFTDVEQINAYVPEVRRPRNKHAPESACAGIVYRGLEMFCGVFLSS